MNFRAGGFRSQRSAVSLDLTPLIDCIFQLLIFFLLTASFITTPNLGVELPQAAAKATTTPDRELMIAVTREGEIRHEGKPLDREGLAQWLRTLREQRGDVRVLIQADTKAYHGDVVRVMDAAQAAGFARLGVAIQSPDR